jgi:hypothetical protein
VVGTLRLSKKQNTQPPHAGWEDTDLREALDCTAISNGAGVKLQFIDLNCCCVILVADSVRGKLLDDCCQTLLRLAKKSVKLSSSGIADRGLCAWNNRVFVQRLKTLVDLHKQIPSVIRGDPL